MSLNFNCTMKVKIETLTVPANIDSLEKIKDYVLSAARQANFGKKPAYKLRLAVDEIATNIITHGYPKAQREENIEVTAEIDPKTLTICLEDTAIPFDPTKQPQPTGNPLDNPPGGLGIFLVMEYVDHFIYKRVNHKNRNILIMNRVQE